MKERIDIGILRFFILFSKILKIREKCKAERIGERVESYPMPTSTLHKGEEKLLQRYFVLLPTR